MKTIIKNVEIARSFSRKVNLGNYETADFFASCKCECSEKESKEKSRELFDLAKSEVENSIKDLKLKNVEKNLEAKLKIAKEEYQIAKRTKNERELLDIRFKIDLIKSEISDCKII